MVESTHISDREAAFQERLEALFKEYNERLSRVIGPLVPNSAVLDDVLQEVWLRVYKYLPRFQGRSLMFTRLYRIAVNTTFTMLKKVWKPSDESVFDKLKSGSEPEKEYEKSMLREDLSNAVATLKKRQQEVFLLRAFQDLSFKEIGETLGVSENNARAAYFHAVRKLRTKLKDHSYDL